MKIGRAYKIQRSVSVRGCRSSLRATFNIVLGIAVLELFVCCTVSTPQAALLIETGWRNAQIINFPIVYILLTICTMSSSMRMWSLPTRCGRCRALWPHTNAYLKDFIMVLCSCAGGCMEERVQFAWASDTQKTNSTGTGFNVTCSPPQCHRNQCQDAHVTPLVSRNTTPCHADPWVRSAPLLPPAPHLAALQKAQAHD